MLADGLRFRLNVLPGRPLVTRLPSVAVLVLLAACTTPPGEGVPDKPAPSPATNSPSTASVPAPAPPPRAPEPERIDPKRLVGLTRDQVAALIGKPNAITDTPPATVWQYRIDMCTLDVMFYMDLGTQTFRALAYEVHVNDPSRQAEPECLGRIRSARHVR